MPQMFPTSSYVPVLALVAASASIAAAQTEFASLLSGSQEVPAVETLAFGSATLTLNEAQDRLFISIEMSGIDIDGNQTPNDNTDDLTVAHIHRAPFGSNGPVVFGFVGPNSDTNGDLVIDPVAGTITSAWDLNEGNNTTLAAELANLFADGLYINIHTNEFRGGEIRGQILLVPTPAAGTMLAGGMLILTRRRR